MNIDNSNAPLAQISSLNDNQNRVNTAQAQHAQIGNPSRYNTVADQATLSTDANLLRRMEATVSSLPVVDTNRVERMQNAIENDHFQVDAGVVARKLYNLESSLQSASA